MLYYDANSGSHGQYGKERRAGQYGRAQGQVSVARWAWPLLNNSKQGPNKTMICSEKFVAVKVAVSSKVV